MEEFQRSLESSTRDIVPVLERLQKLNALWQIFWFGRENNGAARHSQVRNSQVKDSLIEIALVKK